MCPFLPSIQELPHHLFFLFLVAWTSSAVAQNPSLLAVEDKKIIAFCMVAAHICSSVGMSFAWHMEAPCKWDARFLLTRLEGVVAFWIFPPPLPIGSFTTNW